MQTHIDDNYMTVTQEDDILTLTWKVTTKNMDGEDFKNEAMLFIGAVKKSNCKKIIVDMRRFFFTLTEELANWRNASVVSVYNDEKVEKFAFIAEEETVNQDNPENTFVTKYFSEVEDAVEWLNS